jgi:hypothetical protein
MHSDSMDCDAMWCIVMHCDAFWFNGLWFNALLLWYDVMWCIVMGCVVMDSILTKWLNKIQCSNCNEMQCLKTLACNSSKLINIELYVLPMQWYSLVSAMQYDNSTFATAMVGNSMQFLKDCNFSFANVQSITFHCI